MTLWLTFITQTGTYLGAFAYSIKTEGNIIKHVKINKTLNNKFQLDQPDENGTGVAKQFDNLEELVDHYKEFGMVDTATSLIRPDTPGQFFFTRGSESSIHGLKVVGPVPETNKILNCLTRCFGKKHF